MASPYRVGTRRVGERGIEQKLGCELIYVTTPRGTYPMIRIKYIPSGILYAEVPLSQLPEDIQELFIKEG